MGVYDYVGGMQVKATPNPEMKRYSLGNVIPLLDGLYLCPDGAFAVSGSVIVYINENEYSKGKLLKPAAVFDKWGNPVSLSELIGRNNPVFQAMQQLQKEKGQGRGDNLPKGGGFDE